MGVREFVETIKEEVCSANIYAELFRSFYRKNDGWATMFEEMADMAMETVEYLQLMCQEYMMEHELTDTEKELWKKSEQEVLKGFLDAKAMMNRI